MYEVKTDIKNKIILVLDDNEITRSSLKTIFEAAGGVVYSAGHLGKGIAILTGLISRQSDPALIIVDVKLPGCYGYEVLRKLQDTLTGHQVPLLLLSMGLSDFAVRRASLYGVVGYVRKPVLIRDLYDFSVEIISVFETNKAKLSIAKVKKAG